MLEAFQSFVERLNTLYKLTLRQSCFEMFVKIQADWYAYLDGKYIVTLKNNVAILYNNITNDRFGI